jgi:hypothetical protein
VKSLTAFACLALLCCSASCGGNTTAYYKATAVGVASVTMSEGVATVTIRPMAETNYYCGSVKIEEGNDAITLYFERNAVGSGSGKSQQEVRVNNPQHKPIKIGDQGGGNLEIWRKP